MKTLKVILYFLSPRERKLGGLLLFMTLSVALLDMIGVASILPFMTVLTNPDIVETNSILNKMFQTSKIFGVKNNQEFIIILGFLVFLILITTLTFKAITTYVQTRFIQMRGYSISKRLLEGYLHQPYSWFLSRHSADLGKNILGEVNIFVGYMSLLIELISKCIVTFVLIVLLVIVDPKLALIIGCTVGLVYGIIYFITHGYVVRMGKKRYETNNLRFKIVLEAFSAAKEVKIGALEQAFIERFSDPAKTYSKVMASSAVIRDIPRFAIEAVGFGGIILIILYMMSTAGNFNQIIPIISLYVFAGYRLMPAVQIIYGSFSKVNFLNTSVNKLYEDTRKLRSIASNLDQEILPLNKTITLKNVDYNYPSSSRVALKNINLTIPVKSIIGLVGVTGSGKTTTVDIILGLLEAQKGTLEVDGKVITEQNSRAWQRSIGYVPQQIFLADDTIEANIAFGVEEKNINREAVKRASKIANLHNFIIDELPNQYKATIGERGVRLSGGQRQRIGIARALYHNPQVLILDEATSALDNQTEKVVMEAVNNLSNNITIILIAHRLSTVKKCDKIFLLEKGEIKNQGTFDELINNSDTL